MRQGQQNRRGRGRNNGNGGNQGRKGQNPLTRSFESTGPDVKLRGTPAHIAEKYMALARDAQSSGDPVLAENYLQHAEHYNRIIMAFREQQIAQGGGDPHAGMPRHRPGFGEPGMMGDEFGDEDGDEGAAGSGDMQVQPQMQQQPRHEGQFRGEGQRFDDRGQRHDGGHRHHYRDRDRDRDRDRQGGFQDREARGDRHDRGDRFDRGDRGERFQRHDRGDRGDRGERFDRGDRQDRFERNEQRGERQERSDRPPPPALAGEGEQPSIAPRREPREARQDARAASSVPHHEQPEFLRRPVRRPRREAAASGDDVGVAPAPVPTSAADGGGE